MVLNGDNIHKIHKKLYEQTINTKPIFPIMAKIASKAYKTIDHRKSKEENGDILLLLFLKNDYNGKTKRIINHNLMEKSEKEKDEIINGYIKESRDLGKWIYLASSHNDCAKDHLPYQGKLYFDDKAPNDVKEYCEKRGMKTIQWVMGDPVWFITRPNCRHFFKSLPIDAVKDYSIKELTRRYKTHRSEGDKSLSTPRKIAIEEYEDRLHMLQGMYNQKPTENLRRKIEKTKILLKKWKNTL